MLFSAVSTYFYYTISLAITSKTRLYGLLTILFFYLFDPLNWYVLTSLFTELPEDMLYAKLWPFVCVSGGIIIGNAQRFSLGNGPIFCLSRNPRQIRVSVILLFKFIITLIALWTYDFCSVNYDRYVGILVYGGVEITSYGVLYSLLYGFAIYDSTRLKESEFDNIYGVLDKKGVLRVIIMDILNFLIQFGFLWMVYVSALVPDPLLWAILMMGVVQLALALSGFMFCRRVKRFIVHPIQNDGSDTKTLLSNNQPTQADSDSDTIND